MRRRILLVTAVIAALVLGGAVAYASIPGPDGVIHGCRKNTDGSLRAIDSAATCPNGWTALDWNQTGPPGLSGMHVVTVSYGDYTSEVRCPGTETAVSVVFSFPSNPVPVWAQPILSGAQPVGYTYTTAQTYQPNAHLTCAVTA